MLGAVWVTESLILVGGREEEALDSGSNEVHAASFLYGKLGFLQGHDGLKRLKCSDCFWRAEELTNLLGLSDES